MATCELKIKVSLAWWLKPYMQTLILVAVITGAEPDLEKLQRIIRKAIRVKVV